MSVSAGRRVADVRRPRPVTGARGLRRERQHRALVAGFSLVVIATGVAVVRPMRPVRTVVWVNGRSVSLATRPGVSGSVVDLTGPQLGNEDRFVAPPRPRPVPELVRPTVATAVASARLPVHAGDILSVSTKKVVGHTPLRITVNGGPALLWSPVNGGDRLGVTSGPDVTERVIARAAAGVAGGLPDVERQLWHPPIAATPVMVGQISGEVVDTGTPPAPPSPARPETAKVVALTFDDGPDPKWTPQVLAILREEGVPATFCIVGRSATRNAALAAAEVAQGHTICNHTADHDVKLDRASHERVVSQIGDGGDMARAATGVTPLFYRPPGGTLSPDIIAVAHANSQRVLYWTVDPSDYLKPPAAVLVERVMSKMVPGAIVLMHDGGGDRSQTVAALRPIIQRLKADGYRFTTPAMLNASA